jgi:hypothetical protein
MAGRGLKSDGMDRRGRICYPSAALNLETTPGAR